MSMLVVSLVLSLQVFLRYFPQWMPFVATNCVLYGMWAGYGTLAFLAIATGVFVTPMICKTCSSRPATGCMSPKKFADVCPEAQFAKLGEKLHAVVAKIYDNELVPVFHWDHGCKRSVALLLSAYAAAFLLNMFSLSFLLLVGYNAYFAAHKFQTQMQTAMDSPAAQMLKKKAKKNFTKVETEVCRVYSILKTEVTVKATQISEKLHRDHAPLLAKVSACMPSLETVKAACACVLPSNCCLQTFCSSCAASCAASHSEPSVAACSKKSQTELTAATEVATETEEVATETTGTQTEDSEKEGETENCGECEKPACECEAADVASAEEVAEAAVADATEKAVKKSGGPLRAGGRERGAEHLGRSKGRRTARLNRSVKELGVLRKNGSESKKTMSMRKM